MYSRKRHHVNYADKPDDDEYIEITRLNHIGEASSWNMDIVESLQITVSNAPNISMLFRQPVLLDDYTKLLVLPEWNIDDDVCNMKTNSKIMTLLSKAHDIYVARTSKAFEEMYVDGFVSSLLNITGFDDYPCRMYPQYSYRALFSNEHSIGSRADFAVLSGTNKMLLVIEDKTMFNATYANDWKEPQVIGEIFVAVHKIVASSTREHPVVVPVELYALRVIGTQFTFYKCLATEEYIKESVAKLPTTSNMAVYRFPPIDKHTTYLEAFDFCNTRDREQILKCMSSIRNAIT